ncbi:ATP-binding protein [Burkholderia gladioli]|uniref:sensor histidine kinase n=1 Tax=Burkholderia gladioli TaxID=28095 RepID=UPI0016404016|nr:ATP-binding protein [Burkholderia gladioli]
MNDLSRFAHRIFKSLTRLGPIRGLTIVAMVAVACLNGHPGISVVSGALDRILFDAMGELYERGHSSKVVVVNIDGPTVGALGMHSQLDQPERFLARLEDARAVVLDLPFAPCSNDAALLRGMRENGRVVLTFPDCNKRGDAIAMLSPDSTLRAVAAGTGQRDITIGHFGVVDGFVPYVRVGDRIYPHAALEALRVAGLTPPVDPKRYLQPHAVAVGQVRADTVLTSLHNPEDLPQYSYIDVLNGRIPDMAFAGKIVFVGHSMWLGEGSFQVSSLNTDDVSRAQLDALITEAVENGHLVRRMPSSTTIPVYILITLGLVLICMLVPGRRMHFAAIGWSTLVFVVPLLLLAFHIWLPVGFLPIMCPLIYGFFAWERHGRMVALLRRELAELRVISASIGSVQNARAHQTPILWEGGELHNVKAAMRQIRAWQRLYVDVINQLPYPVFLTMSGKVTVWNAKAADVLSTPNTKEAAMGGAVMQIEALVAESIRFHRNFIREVNWNGREHTLICEPLSAGAGESATEVAADNEAAVSHLVCLIDVADLKSIVSHDKLMLRHIAHDMRSPLSSILALIERRGLEVPASSISAGDDETFLNDLRQQADYSLRVANGFVQLSRAEQLVQEYFVPILLDDVAGQAIDRICVQAQQKSIALVGPGVVGNNALVLGDPGMLERALVNVLDNAVKYSPAHTTIEVWVTAERGDYFALHVKDQGIGMSEDSVRKLFEPFFQAQRRRDTDAGVGLGMPFVKTVIERHGGEVTVSSGLGIGTEFVIRMPAMRAG